MTIEEQVNRLASDYKIYPGSSFLRDRIKADMTAAVADAVSETRAESRLIHLGHFTLNSLLETDWKLICDQFIRDNIDGLVHLIRRLVGPFSAVYGVPRGGLVLEEALMPHVSRGLSSTVLLLDDVLTTSGSMQRAREKLAGSYQHIIGAVVFARGPLPSWIEAIFPMPSALWLKQQG